jgi:hypothetical protein
MFILGSQNLGLSIEMSSYAILTLVNAGGDENMAIALNAVKWISKQRNGDGGFVSTQVICAFLKLKKCKLFLFKDTVVALEALATYASSIPTKNVKMELQVINEEVDDEIFDFYVNDDNKQILQQRELSHVPTNLHWTAKGRGCSLIQVHKT